MLVSAIVTTYNSAASIRRVLDGLLGQDGRGSAFELEVIVADDRSTDDTRDIVAAYPEARLVVNAANSGGPNRGRNAGLRLARGDAIAIVDHDDEWLPHRLATQLPALARAPIVTCGYTVVDERTGRRQTRSQTCPAGVRYFDAGATFRARLARAPRGQTTYLGTLLYSGALRHVRFEETYGAVDYDFLLRLFDGRTSAEVCAPLYRRYVDGANLSLDADYRRGDYALSRATLRGYLDAYPAEAARGLRRLDGSFARYCYLVGDMPEARRYLRRAGLTAKHALYYATSYAGADLVRRYFNVFG